MNLRESLVHSISNAGIYNPADLAAPRVILWPDKDRLWSEVVPHLRSSYPNLWSFGEYDPDKDVGPAAWLRYRLDRLTAEFDQRPWIYLPGIGRADFRNAEQFPEEAKHLFAWQFQGQFWNQRNGKDWTPVAFLSSESGGLGLDVSGDAETKRAVQECLVTLLEVDLSSLGSGKLLAGDFRALVTKDPAKTLLKWIGDPKNMEAQLRGSPSGWESFCAICNGEYQFDPNKDGAITAAEKLVGCEGNWEAVWRRFTEAPRLYPGVKELLETIQPQTLFEESSEYLPSINSRAEKSLESSLLKLADQPAPIAIDTIKQLHAEHAPRADYVWKEFGETSLAQVVVDFHEMITAMEIPCPLGDWNSLGKYYLESGWRVDHRVLTALDKARTSNTLKAITAAIRAVYLPWLTKMAEAAQALAGSYSNPGVHACRNLAIEPGTVYLFSDGLRMDVANSLLERLIAKKYSVILTHSWAALPTVTATAKPAWNPLAQLLIGAGADEGFCPTERSSGKRMDYVRFKQLLEDSGLVFIDSEETPQPSCCGWTEFGSLDSMGHKQGYKLAWRIEEELAGLTQRVSDFLSNGWSKVQIITDHGWLLVPGELQPVPLPKHLTASRWGRCAMPHAGAQHGFPLTPWFWAPQESVVLAPGVTSFLAGNEYAHGGLSLQEACIPSLTVTASDRPIAQKVEIKELKWAGLRLNVILNGVDEGMSLDLRAKVADPASSFAAKPETGLKSLKKISLLVENDDAQGSAAFLVVLNESNDVVFKQQVVIGEN